MSSAHCIVPISGDNYFAQDSNLSEDGMMCSLGAIAFWNADM